MKAAKDGQDNHDCNLVYATCTQSDAPQASPMAYTFQDINKLVQARRLSRNLANIPLASVTTQPLDGVDNPSSSVESSGPAASPSQPPIAASAGYQPDSKDVNNVPAKVMEKKDGVIVPPPPPAA